MPYLYANPGTRCLGPGKNPENMREEPLQPWLHPGTEIGNQWLHTSKTPRTVWLMTKMTEAERRQAAMARKGIRQPKLPAKGLVTGDVELTPNQLLLTNKALAEHREAVRKLEKAQTVLMRGLVKTGQRTWAQLAADQGVTRQALQKQVRKYFPED